MPCPCCVHHAGRPRLMQTLRTAVPLRGMAVWPIYPLRAVTIPGRRAGITTHANGVVYANDRPWSRSVSVVWLGLARRSVGESRAELGSKLACYRRRSPRAWLECGDSDTWIAARSGARSDRARVATGHLARLAARRNGGSARGSGFSGARCGTDPYRHHAAAPAGTGLAAGDGAARAPFLSHPRNSSRRCKVFCAIFNTARPARVALEQVKHG